MLVGPLRRLADRLGQPREAADIDATDVKLLQLLTEDGRASLKHLAAEVGLSSPAVSDRIARLVSKGVIRGFTADVDWDLLGFSTVAFLSVKSQAGHDQELLHARLNEIDGVEEISVVTGSTDMFVKIRAHGFEDMRQLLARDIWPIEGLAGTTTSIALFSDRVPGAVAARLERLASEVD